MSTSKLSFAQREQLKSEMGGDVWEYYNIKDMYHENMQHLQKLKRERMDILSKKPDKQDAGKLNELDKLIQRMQIANAQTQKKIEEYPGKMFGGYTYNDILGPMAFEDWPAWNKSLRTGKRASNPYCLSF